MRESNLWRYDDAPPRQGFGPGWTAWTTGDGAIVEELIRTNDMVLISYVEALLKEAGIVHMVVDQNMSVIEGSLGVLPRRVLVDRDELARAHGIIEEAGIGDELRKQP